MSKKCPPGTFCIENMTMVFVIIVLFIVTYIVFKNNRNDKTNTEPREIHMHSQMQFTPPNPFFTKPNATYTNVPGDTLMNPYAPPLQPSIYRMPINVPTNVGYNGLSSYRQVGILTPHDKRNGPNNNNNNNKHNHNDKILPLMGRPLFTNRDKWQYYTMSDQNNSVKLPVVVKGRSGLNEYGVDRLYDRDAIFVEGYNQAFLVNVYENNEMQYMPSYL
jgi:hypothetical protein